MTETMKPETNVAGEHDLPIPSYAEGFRIAHRPDSITITLPLDFIRARCPVLFKAIFTNLYSFQGCRNCPEFVRKEDPRYRELNQ